MREYETTIIVQPEISDEGTAAIFERLEGILADSGSIRLQNESLGKRKLAYEIRRFHKGHYYIFSFLSDGQVVPALERALRLNESILRFMTIQANPDVTDIEARKVEAAEAEAEQERKAAERAAREEEEAKAREEEETKARAESERLAAEAAEAAEATTDDSTSDAADKGESSDDSEDAAESTDAAADTKSADTDTETKTKSDDDSAKEGGA